MFYTYRTIETLDTQAGQDVIVDRMREFLLEVREAFQLDIVAIHTVAGRLYIRLSGPLNREDIPPSHYGLEPVGNT